MSVEAIRLRAERVLARTQSGRYTKRLMAYDLIFLSTQLRYHDAIVESLRFISDKSGSGDYSEVIADMATELLVDLRQT